MSEQLPEYYSDGFYIRTTPWGVVITLVAASPKDEVPDHDTCVVRLSHATAKAMSMVLRKHLKSHEKDTDTTIGIPAKVMNGLDIAPEDW